MPRALLSVSDKTGIVDLARQLTDRGFEIVSTGGTARALGDAGVAVLNVSDVTRFPEMMDGRVKTLHPAIHAGILARRGRADDMTALGTHAITPIDVVVVNLYPFEATAARPGVSFDELVEQIDIGGPSLLRAAAKNFQDVLVVVDPADYARLIAGIDASPDAAFRLELMRKAFAHTAAYDTAIAGVLAGTRSAEDRPAEASPSTFEIALEKIGDLRYGENPHQPAAWYRAAGGARHGDTGARGFSRAGLGAADVLQGKELSYTNLLDLDAAARIVLEFDEPAAVVIKHTNPCGAAIGASPVDAYTRARDADSLSAFGGIVGLNRPIDIDTAQAIASTRIDAVIAPAVHADARPVLARKTNMRVVIADFSAWNADASAPADYELRSILGAVLAQARDRVVEARRPWSSGSLPDGFSIATKRQPTSEEWEALRFAWRICAHVKSNTVIFTGATRTLAIGAGQMSRVDAVNVAVAKAGGAQVSLHGSVAASDAFFPFRDGLDAVAKAGATAVVQPGGSVKDGEVIAAADEHGLAMVFTGRRHFRH